MKVSSITLRNWRGFGSSGAKLDLDREFIAIVGPNNSGKSSLLRSVYELRGLFAVLSSWKAGESGLEQFLRGEHGNVGWPVLQVGERLVPLDGGGRPRVLISFDGECHPDTSKIVGLELVMLETRWDVDFVLGDRSRQSGITQAGGSSAGDGHTFLRVQGAAGLVTVDWDALVGAIRPLRDSFYIGAFRNAINSGGGDYYDLKVGKDFIAAFDAAKNGPDPASNEAVHAMLRELCDIFGFSTLDVSVSQDKSHLVFNVDGRSLRGSELGAGITQFVVVAAMVMVRRPSMLLIDEPELSLHASLQQRFLTLLARYVSGPVVFSTHWLGLARTTADKIIVCQRAANGAGSANELTIAPNLALTLGQLGYGGYHNESYKAVLLVEGVTEIRVFKALLALYGISNEVVVLMLGGDALARGGREFEREELRRLSELVFAVVDSEAENEGAGAASHRSEFSVSCKAAGIRCHVLKKRSIENYLDKDVARTQFGCPDATDFDDYQKPGIEWSWNKDRNWRIATARSRQQVDGTDLGDFLTELSAAVHERSAGDHEPLDSQ